MIALWSLAGGLVGAASGLTTWWTVSHLGQDMRLSPLALAWGGLIFIFVLLIGKTRMLFGKF